MQLLTYKTIRWLTINRAMEITSDVKFNHGNACEASASMVFQLCYPIPNADLSGFEPATPRFDTLEELELHTTEHLREILQKLTELINEPMPEEASCL